MEDFCHDLLDICHALIDFSQVTKRPAVVDLVKDLLESRSDVVCAIAKQWQVIARDSLGQFLFRKEKRRFRRACPGPVRTTGNYSVF